MEGAAYVGRINEYAEARVDGADVVVFQVDLKESLPVQVVLFFVDADMNKDRRYDDVRTITLSYTFYEAKTERAKTLLGGTPANGTGKGG